MTRLSPKQPLHEYLRQDGRFEGRMDVRTELGRIMRIDPERIMSFTARPSSRLLRKLGHPDGSGGIAVKGAGVEVATANDAALWWAQWAADFWKQKQLPDVRVVLHTEAGKWFSWSYCLQRDGDELWWQPFCDKLIPPLDAEGREL